MRPKHKITNNIFALVLGLLFLNSCEEKNEDKRRELSVSDRNTITMLQDYQHCNMALAKFILEKWIIDGNPPSLKTVLSYMKVKDNKMKNEASYVPIFVDYDNRYQLVYNESNFLLLSHPQQYGEIPYVNKSIKENEIIYSVVFMPLKMLYKNETEIKNKLQAHEDDSISLETYQYLTKYVKKKKKAELLHNFQTNLSRFKNSWKESKSLVELPDDDSKFINAHMQSITLKEIMNVISQNRKQITGILNKYNNIKMEPVSEK